jgi:uncharacterized protein (UPF0261 family)
MKKTIGMIGAFDTKGAEYAFVRDAILARGHGVVAINTGVMDTTKLLPVDVEAAEIAAAGGSDLEALRAKQDRGAAMKAMAAGAARLLPRLVKERSLDGVIGMGGTGGTSVIGAAFQALPIGFPKLCVSTAAAGNVAPYVGTKDIVMMPSIVDVAGINRISRLIFSRAAGAICGMVESEPAQSTDDRPVITASMFGNTTTCVNACVETLTQKGYEVLVFHATGTGGRTMESLVDDGLVDAVLDITTTEWADTVAGGVFDAGSDRLSAPGRRGIPHLICNGCIDMVNFGAPSTVPEKYKGRLFYEWNPSVTLMRTDIEENRRMGQAFAEKANAAKGPVAFLLAMKGVSILDGDGERFCDRAADQAFVDALKQDLRPGIPVVEFDANINDPAFSTKAVEMMLGLVAANKR